MTTTMSKRKDREMLKLLKNLLKTPEFDLYSKRYRNQVWSIVDWMISHDDDVLQVMGIKAMDYDVAWRLGVLAESKKRLSVYEEEHGTSWHHSLCHPLNRKHIIHEGFLDDESEKQVNLLEDILSPVEMCKSKETSKDMLMEYDVVSLLSLGGDGQTLVARTGERIVLKPDTFRGKYVLVCCVEAPVLSSYTSCFQSHLNFCNELPCARSDVEMVMVARMNILADSKRVFDHLFSGFPKSCLAVPYGDWEPRERILNLLSCDFPNDTCLVYHTDGLFLTSFCFNGDESPYGAEAFPFTKEILAKMSAKRMQLRRGRLENFLRPYESSPDVVVYVYNPTRGPEKAPRCISEVTKNKHVGLYLCCERGGRHELLHPLHKLYEQCKEKQLEFEIVVLYLPFNSGIDPDLFKEKIDEIFQKHKILGWGCLPFNNSVSLRFRDFTRHYDDQYMTSFHEDKCLEDKLIIVGPCGKILDMFGAEVVGHLGHRISSVYPFTRTAIVEKEMREIRELRLESLLVGQLFRGNDPSDVISVDELLANKKKIVVYIGKFDEARFDVDKKLVRLVSEYKEKKKSGDDAFEVVFVEFPQEIHGGVTNDIVLYGVPWYIHRPLDGTNTHLARHLNETFVGFGEDGRVCSVKPLWNRYRKMDDDDDDTRALCWDDTLFQDIYQLHNLDEYGDI